jgi:RHS repeat-associated protein
MRILFLLLACTSLLADEIPELGTIRVDPSMLLHDSVHVISGAYIEANHELTVNCHEPIPIGRVYCGSDKPNEWKKSQWRFEEQMIHMEIWPEGAFRFLRLDSAIEGTTQFKPVGEWNIHDGSAPFVWEARPKEKEHYSNTGSGVLSGRNDERNAILRYYAGGYYFELIRPDGERRFYRTKEEWGDTKRVKEKKNRQIRTNHFRLTRVVRPNGNILDYTYDEAFTLLVRIESKNAAETVVYGWADFSYEWDGPKRWTYVKTSDGQTIARSEHRWKDAYLLDKIVTSKGADQAYDYQKTSVINRRGLRGECERQIRYLCGRGDHYPDGRQKLCIRKDDPREGKVMNQTRPVGSKGEHQRTASYYYIYKYNTNSKSLTNCYRTKCYSALGALTIYYHKNGRLTEKARNGLSVEHQEWTANGRLARYAKLGPGYENYLTADYRYDELGNVLEEIISGEEIEQTRAFTYDCDNFSLPLTESDGVVEKRYTYVPGTNLPASEEVYEANQLVQRTTHTYDDTFRVSSVVESFSDGEVVHTRSTHWSTDRQDHLPSEIEQHINGHLIQRVVLHRDLKTQVTAKDVYDAYEQHRYTLYTEYDENGRVVGERDALGQRRTYTYDEVGNRTSAKTPLTETKYTYDLADRLICEKKGSLARHYAYDWMGNRTAEVDACGNRTEYVYDKFGRCIEERGKAIAMPGGLQVPVVKREYDAFDRVICETDPRGFRTHTSYNGRGQVLSRDYPDGTREEWEYYPDGRLRKEVAKNGTYTVYERDWQDRVLSTEVYSADGALLKSTHAVYAGPLLVSQIDAEEVETCYEYNGRGQMSAMVRAGRRIEYSYDALGRMVEQREPFTVSRWEYDLLDRVTAEEVAGVRTTYRYDAEGNQIEVKCHKNRTLVDYDAHGRPTLMVDALGNKTTYHYDQSSVLTETVVDANDVATITVYDPAGNPTLIKRTEGGLAVSCQEILYDLAGNVVCHRHGPVETLWEYNAGNQVTRLEEGAYTPITRVTTYEYDEFGRESAVNKPSGARLETTYDPLGRIAEYWKYAYTYDKCDRLLSVTGPEGTTTRTYDQHGKLISETLATGHTLTSEYDAQGRRNRLTLPHGEAVTYTYDANHLRAVSYVGHSHHYLAYDLAGNLLEEQFINGDICTHAYDRLDRATSHNLGYHCETLTYDAVGQITALTLNGEDSSYTYDPLGQLTSEPDHTYTYDTLYNRTSHNDTRQSYNALNQPNDAEYSPDGHLLSYQDARYAYDELGRLITVTTDATTITYSYDAFNRCLKINDTHLIYDGDCEIGAIENSVVTQLRILGSGLGAEIGAAILIQLNETTYTPLHDYRGSLIGILSPWPWQDQRVAYTVFGEPDGPALPWGFCSKRTDPTGLIHFGHRAYHPSLARFLTPDPASYSQGPNLYAYCLNNPLTHLDWWGLAAESIHQDPLIGFGRGVELYGKHIADPLHRPGLMDFGARAQGKQSDPHLLYPQPEIIRVGARYTPDPKFGVVHVNGIMNDRDEVADTARWLSDRLQMPVVGVCNTSRGFRSDLVSGTGAALGFGHPSVPTWLEGTNEEFKRVGPNGWLMLSGHSMGSAVLSYGLDSLTTRQRQHSMAITYGGIRFVAVHQARVTLNVYDFNDPISHLGFLLSLGRRNERFNVLPVSSKNRRIYGSAHPFRGGGYEAHFIEAVQNMRQWVAAQ